MHLLISVIVPVYNVEKYLDRCIDEFNHRTRRFGGVNETKNN